MDPLISNDQAAVSMAARIACAAVIDATVAVTTQQCLNAFIACRPSGHLAHASKAQGYCFFNNISIAAKTCLRYGLASRVMIVVRWIHMVLFKNPMYFI